MPFYFISFEIISNTHLKNELVAIQMTFENTVEKFQMEYK